jgi:hypothetical protein
MTMIDPKPTLGGVFSKTNFGINAVIAKTAPPIKLRPASNGAATRQQAIRQAKVGQRR